MTQKKFIFKDYYNSHPEFREKHLLKMKESIHCDLCNCDVRKHLLKRHETSKKHQKKLIIEEPDRLTILENRIKELENKLISVVH